MAGWQGAILGISWLIAWYLFFVHYARPRSGARGSVVFTLTSIATATMLVMWTASIWLLPPQTIEPWEEVASILLLWAGLYVWVMARRALPLSNTEVIFRLSHKQVKSGVYTYLSHPMYVGLVCALAGSSWLLGNGPAFAASGLVGVVLCMRALVESRA